MTYNFDDAREQWSRPPVEHMGYTNLTELLGSSDQWLQEFAKAQCAARYDGWRNHQGLWATHLHEFSEKPLRILDFGCGSGIESLQLCRQGHKVILADISASNLAFASALLRAHDFVPIDALDVRGSWPYVADVSVDCFYANGVLHHTPAAGDILRRALDLLADGGHARLMLYSEQAWAHHCGLPLPDDVTADPRFDVFVRTMDSVGTYADYYTETKLARLVEGIFTVRSFDYITSTRDYAVAVLDPKQ